MSDELLLTGATGIRRHGGARALPRADRPATSSPWCGRPTMVRLVTVSQRCCATCSASAPGGTSAGSTRSQPICCLRTSVCRLQRRALRSPRALGTSSMSPRRCPSHCRSRRHERSTSRGRAACSRSPSLASERGGLRRYAHVSTAYVAGTHAGRFLESDHDVAQTFRNSYEQSKFEAERLVRDAAGLPTMILRPSIVVGDRNSGWTSAFNVLYWPLRAFARGLYPAVPAVRSSPVDVVSIDYVADAIYELCQSSEAVGQTYHLTAGPQASSVGELVDLASRYFKRPASRGALGQGIRGVRQDDDRRAALGAWPERRVLPVLRCRHGVR